MKRGALYRELILAVVATGYIACLSGCNRAPAPVVTENTTPQPVAKESSTPVDRPYSWGIVIKCGKDQNSDLYRTLGWSEPEEAFTWTVGKRAELLFRTAPTSHPLQLRMRLAGNKKPPELPFQPVEVFANGKKIADWQVGESSDYTADIAEGAMSAGGELRIELKTPNAASPKSLGIAPDPRVLGLCCWEYAITEV